MPISVREIGFFTNNIFKIFIMVDAKASDLRVTIGQHEVNTQDYISVAIKEDHPDYQK